MEDLLDAFTEHGVHPGSVVWIKRWAASLTYRCYLICPCGKDTLHKRLDSSVFQGRDTLINFLIKAGYQSTGVDSLNYDKPVRWSFVAPQCCSTCSQPLVVEDVVTPPMVEDGIKSIPVGTVYSWATSHSFNQLLIEDEQRYTFVRTGRTPKSGKYKMKLIKTGYRIQFNYISFTLDTDLKMLSSIGETFFPKHYKK